MSIHNFVLIVIITFTGCNFKMQDKAEEIKINEIKIYKDIDERGYTTVEAFKHFDDLALKNVEKINVAVDDLKKIGIVMSDAKTIKHFQRKLSGGLIFCEIQYEGYAQISRVVMSIETESVGIMDLTNRKDFVTRNQTYLDWLQKLKYNVKVSTNSE